MDHILYHNKNKNNLSTLINNSKHCFFIQIARKHKLFFNLTMMNLMNIIFSILLIMYKAIIKLIIMK